MSQKINIRPTTGVYATYKNIKYDAWTAIAEFVDNSTQSFYDHEDELSKSKDWNGLQIHINHGVDQNKVSFIEIIDNAYGMDFKDFQRAIILDSKPKVSTRSEFGMGLKTAACWFGVNWSVETTKLNSGTTYKATVDVEKLSRTKDEEITYEKNTCDKNKHGTVIKIWNLNRRLLGRAVENTKKKLQGMYRVDLQTGKIKIYYRREPLIYTHPKIFIEQLPGGNTKEWKKNISFEIDDNNKQYHVHGFIGILETGDTYGAGFTLIRRGRVIIGGYNDCYRPPEVFKASTTAIYQRLFGELNLDDWPVTQTKDSFDWYNGLEDKLIEKLVEQTDEFRKKATEAKKNRDKNINIGSTDPITSFSDTGVIKDLEIKEINNLQIIDNTDSSEKEIKESAVNNNHVQETETTIYDNIVVSGNKDVNISFACSGRKYSFNLKQKTSSSLDPWLKILNTNGESDTYSFEVEWNIAHPFFRPYLENQITFDVMKKFIFALVLSEKEALALSSDKKIEPDAIRMQMNNTLNIVMGGDDNEHSKNQNELF